MAREVAALAITLHTSLIKSAVRDVLDLPELGLSVPLAPLYDGLV